MDKTSIRYIVDDVESSIDFYTTYLGFQVQIHPAPGFAALDLGGIRLLLNQPEAGGAGQDLQDGRTPKPGGWYRIQLQTNDLKSFYDRLQEKGVNFVYEIVEGKGGMQVLLEDPSGNIIEIFESNEKESSDDRNETFQPEGYSSVTPNLAIRKADNLASFLKKIFNATEHRLWREEDGSFVHGEFHIGDSMIMIGDVKDRFDPFPGMLYVYVPDVDATYKKAMSEGATSVEEPADQEYGDRRAAFSDPAGNKWYVASRQWVDEPVALFRRVFM